MINASDSAARISIQAAEYIRRFGALVPFEVCPPLLPLLIAALGCVGVPERAGCVLILLAAYAGGCAAVYFLILRFRPRGNAAFAVVLYALAPTRLPPASLDSGTVLLFWSLVPLLLIAIDSARRRPRPVNVARALLLAALVWAAHAAHITMRDFFALGELVLILAVSLLSEVAFRRAVLAGFLAMAGWAWLLPTPARAPRASDPLTSDGLTSAGWISDGLDASSLRVFGSPSLETELNSVQSQVDDVISSPGRLAESLLWLRAMAVESFFSQDRQKFDGALECLQERAGWCLYGLPDPNPAPAVLVSRHQWQKLPPIRGLYDIESLEQYLAWSSRPEPAGFHRVDGSTIEVHADLGPLDMMLVRRNCQAGWHAYVDSPTPREDSHAPQKNPATPQELAIECDPLGFMVLDPARTGDTLVRLKFEPSWQQRLWPQRLHSPTLLDGEFPRITPGGVIEAVEFKSPPFQHGASLSIFGHNFDPANTRVLFDSAPGDVLWVGPQQINVRLPQDATPGDLSIVVESSGRRSYAETIEVAP